MALSVAPSVMLMTQCSVESGSTGVRSGGTIRRATIGRRLVRTGDSMNRKLGNILACCQSVKCINLGKILETGC